jgi:hypothetical protein
MQTRTISTNAAIDLVDEVIVGTRKRGTESLIGGPYTVRYITNVPCRPHRKRVQTLFPVMPDLAQHESRETAKVRV